MMSIRRTCLRSLSRLAILQNSQPAEQQKKFLQEYRIRSLLEQPLYYYSRKPLPEYSMHSLYEQSRQLSEESILGHAKETIESLLIYNARRLREYRNLPYLVVLNPAISESYNIYLQGMSSLILASLNPPSNVTEHDEFLANLREFIELHADTLPSLSKGFSEVAHLLPGSQIKNFLDEHLKERIRMRLIAHQHVLLSESLSSGLIVPGGDFNGVIKQLNITEVVKKNADGVNDLCLLKYDQSVPIKVDYSQGHAYWSKKHSEVSTQNSEDLANFPYIEYHLNYIFTELFKNSFRSHIENGVADPVQITISTSGLPSPYLEVRIRDKGKGIPPAVLRHTFDYSFTTFESGEGDAYKTLNVPPGLAGNTVAGMGYGLPLLKNYIELFNEGSKTNGSLTIQTYHGWGTDVYLKTVGL